MRLRLAATLAVTALLFIAGRAGAQATTPYKVLVTVDAVQIEGGELLVTGIVQGETAPTTWRLMTATYSDPNVLANCQQQALLAMTKPGQYLYGIVYGPMSLYGCKLTRVAP